MATNMKTSERKFITVEDLENSGPTGAVWVMNTTDSYGQEGGNLIFSVPKLNGQGIDPVRVPKTFIPVDITGQVPRAQLLASSEFRNSVRLRNIRICNPAYAKHILSKDEAKEEQRRIDNMMVANKAAINAAMVINEEDEYFDPNDKDAEIPRSKMREEVQEREVAKAAAKAQIKIQQIAADATNENWAQSRIVAAVTNVTKVTETDLKFLARKFPTSPKVIKYLKERRKEVLAATK